jgi:hypothetical protein
MNFSSEKRARIAAPAYWFHGLCACYVFAILSGGEGWGQVLLMLSMFLFIPMAFLAFFIGLATVPTALLSLLLLGVLIEPPGDIIHPAYVLTCFLFIGVRVGRSVYCLLNTRRRPGTHAAD